jgi:hypothetical protein
MGRTGIAFQDARKVNLAMAKFPASDRMAFALSLLETGLRMCRAEKSRDNIPFSAEQSVLCAPVC